MATSNHTRISTTLTDVIEIVAGITLAALAIPEVMGYTKISGASVITGLYTILVPSALFAIFGSSRHLVVARPRPRWSTVPAGAPSFRYS
jgi:sulfate permease, SulP family